MLMVARIRNGRWAIGTSTPGGKFQYDEPTFSTEAEARIRLTEIRSNGRLKDASDDPDADAQAESDESR